MFLKKNLFNTWVFNIKLILILVINHTYQRKFSSIKIYMYICTKILTWKRADSPPPPPSAFLAFRASCSLSTSYKYDICRSNNSPHKNILQMNNIKYSDKTVFFLNLGNKYLKGKVGNMFPKLIFLSIPFPF